MPVIPCLWPTSIRSRANVALYRLQVSQWIYSATKTVYFLLGVHVGGPKARSLLLDWKMYFLINWQIVKSFCNIPSWFCRPGLTVQTNKGLLRDVRRRTKYLQRNFRLMFSKGDFWPWFGTYCYILVSSSSWRSIAWTRHKGQCAGSLPIFSIIGKPQGSCSI